ncbi:MAG: GNAT family N-acetyltransferase [Sphingobacteriales bacterium]|nr:MAG: GNAT family N-acetyltransferase [Sphingobacteriales bacterium]
MILRTITENDFTYIIRHSKPEDFEQVFQIWYDNQVTSLNRDIKNNLLLYKNRFQNNFKNQDGNFKFWVAEYDSIIIGFQSSNRTESNPVVTNEQAESSTYIKIGFGGKNIGYNIMKICLEELINTEIMLFYGKIIITNIAMIKIVEKLGWIKIGVTPESIKYPKFPKSLLYVYNVPEK